MSLFNYFKGCLPSIFLPRQDLSSCVNNDVDMIDKSICDEDDKDYPIIHVFGHGWDPTDDDHSLYAAGYKKVSSGDIDNVWLYGLEYRGPYIECADDNTDDNVVRFDNHKVPNLLISLADFKGSVASKLYRFGIWCDNVDQTSKWLEQNTSIFTLKDLVRSYNEVYPDGYYLELHVSRIPLREFDYTKLPSYVQYTVTANEMVHEYSTEEWRKYYDNNDKYSNSLSMSDGSESVEVVYDPVFDSDKSYDMTRATSVSSESVDEFPESVEETKPPYDHEHLLNTYTDWEKILSKYDSHTDGYSTYV
jgi:hypothetical protein